MLEPLRNLFRSRPAAPERPRATIPAGQRVYVIGDIHGRLDLFNELIHAIEQDDLDRAPAETTVILLGDLVDRGPESAGVIARARAWQMRRKVRILAGNHEEMFLESFEDIEMLKHFLRHGGRSTIFSYGLDRERYNKASLGEVQEMMEEAVPQVDRDFLDSFETHLVIGDYLFVHAGIAPGVPLEEQKRRDMLWIRGAFLRHEEPFEHVVVHGHTIEEEVTDTGIRIGIDTGAFRSGILTALVLEGDTRRLIQTHERDGDIAVEQEEYQP